MGDTHDGEHNDVLHAVVAPASSPVDENEATKIYGPITKEQFLEWRPDDKNVEIVEEGDCGGFSLQECLDNWVNGTDMVTTDTDLWPCEFDFFDRFFDMGTDSVGKSLIRPALMF